MSDDDVVAMGKVAAQTLEHLPPPGYGELERHFEFSLPEYDLPVYLHGFQDIYIPDQGVLPDANPEDRDVPLVADHKTSSDPDRWGLDEETLPEDIQQIIYTHDAMLTTGSEYCDALWSYSATRGALRAKPVRIRVERGETEERINRKVLPVVNDIVTARKECTDAKELPWVLDSCSAFGGCDYRDYCDDLNVKSISYHLFGGDKREGDKAMANDIMKRLKEKRAAEASKEKPKKAEAASITPPDQPAPDKISEPTEEKPETKKKPAKKKQEVPAATANMTLHDFLTTAVSQRDYRRAAALSKLLLDEEAG